MTELDLLHRLHRHRRWSQQRVLDACAPLNREPLERGFEMGRGSLWNTIVHLCQAERVWLAALRGRGDEPVRAPADLETLEALREAWETLGQEWADYLDQLNDAQLDRLIPRTNSRGETFSTPVRDVLLQLYDHNAYTTAQAANMLRHLGIDPPDRSLIAMSRMGA